jgi:hypothetical protein
MSTPVAGWYPDPAGSGGLRWWNGVAWGHQVQPAAQPVVHPGAAGQSWDAGSGDQPWGAGQQWGPGQPGQPWTPGAPAQPWAGQQAQQAPAGFAQRNRNSLIVAVIAVVYVVLAATVHIVVLGILPVLFGVRAVQAKEPLAWPAVVVAAGVLVFALVNFAR